MEDGRKTSFWKNVLPVIVLVLVIGGLGVYGIYSLIQAIAARQKTPDPTAAPVVTVAPAPTVDPGPTPGVISSGESGEARVINRNFSAFLDRMGEIEQVFV